MLPTNWKLHGGRHYYVIPRLTKEEFATLEWLARHGYDGNILAVAGVLKHYSDGGARLDKISEPEAWEIKEYIDNDPDAWLASNGSRSLARKLNRFVESIV